MAVTGLLTDLYELTMAVSYLRRGIDGPATFSLFVRSMPEGRGFLVAAGLDDALALLERYRFEEDDLRYVRELLDLSRQDVLSLRRLRFTGEVRAVPEGRIVFAGEPLLEVTAPIAEAQLVETLLLNQVTFQTTIATKAARCVLAAAGRDLVDFSFRRTQGLEAAGAVARLTAMVGFAATSNVEAARRHGLRASGTMAHSYVEAFASEQAAFEAFARDFGERSVFLVDTYDTRAGVHRAIDAIRRCGLSGRVGIRLDSGDLGEDARRARAALDGAGLEEVRILASGGLDELEIDELVRSRAPIDAFGVGTKMGVSADHPYLDTAYKLVQMGPRPVMKLSEGKINAPGPKQVFRWPGMRDMIGLREEPVPAGAEDVLGMVMAGGRRRSPPDALAIARERFEADLRALPATARDLRAPRAPRPVESAALRRLAATTRRSLTGG